MPMRKVRCAVCNRKDVVDTLSHTPQVQIMIKPDVWVCRSCVCDVLLRLKKENWTTFAGV